MKEKLIAMLIAAGVANPEAVAEAMMKDSANGKILIDDGKDNVFVPKSRLDDELGKKKSIKDQLDTANTTIKGLEKEVEGNQTALDSIATYKLNAEKAETQLAATIKNQAIKEAIGTYEKKAFDADAIMAFIDKDNLIVKDGKVAGLTEQLNTLATSKSFLFQPEADGDNGGTGGTGNPGNPGAGAGVGGAGKKGDQGKASIGATLGKDVTEITKAPTVSFFN